MYAVFVDNEFLSTYQSKFEAKEIAEYFRKYECIKSKVVSLTRNDLHKITLALSHKFKNRK